MLGSKCLAREVSALMLAKLQAHLLLQFMQHLHLLQSADTLLVELTSLAAVIHPNLR